MLSAKLICDQHHANFSKQTTLLDGIDVGPPKWRVCGLAWSLESMDSLRMINISNVKVHLRNRSENVNSW